MTPYRGSAGSWQSVSIKYPVSFCLLSNKRRKKKEPCPGRLIHLKKNKTQSSCLGLIIVCCPVLSTQIYMTIDMTPCYKTRHLIHRLCHEIKLTVISVSFGNLNVINPSTTSRMSWTYVKITVFRKHLFQINWLSERNVVTFFTEMRDSVAVSSTDYFIEPDNTS